MATNVGPTMQAVLERYGLGSLAPWLSEKVTSGATLEEIELELYDRPEFITRFPAIRIRGREGLPPLSVDEYLSYENTMSQVSKAFGVSLTKSEVDDLLSHNVSAAEAQERIGLAAQAVYSSPQETRDELQRLYGVGAGDLVRFWLDPKKEMPTLQRRFVTSQISSAAIRTGFDAQLTAAQGERLFEAGLTGESAMEGFGRLVEAQELFQATDATEDDLTVDDQVELLAGDQDIAQTVARRGERRAARFKEGGSFASGREGLGGLGSANTA